MIDSEHYHNHYGQDGSNQYVMIRDEIKIIVSTLLLVYSKWKTNYHLGHSYVYKLWNAVLGVNDDVMFILLKCMHSIFSFRDNSFPMF